jgi:6-pyruvoyl-tetrahydropterin synthase
LIFESENLDDRNWVFDFGGLKQFKDWAEHMFDHTLVIAADDPHLAFFEKMADIGYEGDKVGVPHERGALSVARSAVRALKAVLVMVVPVTTGCPLLLMLNVPLPLKDMAYLPWL